MSPPAIQAAKEATTTIPIVMAFSSIDPIINKFVDSLARPGGNITGVAMIADEITGKRLAVLEVRDSRDYETAQAHARARVGVD